MQKQSKTCQTLSLFPRISSPVSIEHLPRYMKKYDNESMQLNSNSISSDSSSSDDDSEQQQVLTEHAHNHKSRR
jgi:hypothetical protein